MELIAKVRAGEKEALGELCNLYRNYMRMVVRTGLGPKLRERVELSDVVQDALVEVVKQFPQFTGQNEAALVGWLRRLVGQKLADLGRYHSRAKRSGGGPDVPLDAAWDLPGGDGSQGGKLLDMLALSQTSPSEAASKRELTALLADALAALPEWNHDACDAALRTLAASEGVKAGLLINATRVAIVGRAVAPPLFDTMVVLGRDRVVSRLRLALRSGFIA